MIYARYANLQKWVNARSLRERILIVALGCAVIYIFWYFLITRPLFFEQKELETKNHALTLQIQTIDNQAKTILHLGTQYNTMETLESKKLLAIQSENLKKNIITTAKSLATEKNIEAILKDILKSSTSGITLVNVRKAGTEPLIPANMDKTDIPPLLMHLHKYAIQIQFQSDYFATITYFNALEKLPWHLYWESMDYKVIAYPNANISVKFYVLINQLG